MPQEDKTSLPELGKACLGLDVIRVILACVKNLIRYLELKQPHYQILVMQDPPWFCEKRNE